MKLPRLILCFLLLLASCDKGTLLPGAKTGSDASVTIAFAEVLSSYSPLSYEAKNREYLANIYEPLVRFDSTFNYDTALAVSWGRLDDIVWDFHIREGVLFHDGSTLDADDVLYSLELVLENESSELGSLLSTLVSVKKEDQYRVSITTSQPDPLLLSKLTYVSIIPYGYENFDLPIGTGPYRVSQFEDNTLILERFDDYWGPLAYFKEAWLKAISDPEERISALLNNEVQLLANVPPQAIDDFIDVNGSDILISDFPSLEVSFLMMNQNGVFADDNLRMAIAYALDMRHVEELGGGYLRGTSQVAATGITGYITDYTSREYNLELAQSFRNLVDGDIAATLDLPLGLETLGELIKTDLAEIDIELTLNFMEHDEFEEKILSGESEMYFFGWKFDLADTADFFASVAHTRLDSFGEFNGMGYSNPVLDLQIEEVSMTMDPNERRARLEDITKLFLSDYPLIPLFESQDIYALRPEVYYDFRMDGLILASEIVGNMVE